MKKAMIAVAAMAASGTAFAGAHAGGGASGPGWTFVDVGYNVGSSFDEDNCNNCGGDSDGFSISGSYGFATKWHVGLEYLDGESFGGSGSGGWDYDGYELVIGGHPAITDNTDLVFEIGYFDFDNDFDINDTGSEDGFSIAFGVRSMLTDNTELSAGVKTYSGDWDEQFGSSTFSGDFTGVTAHAGGQYMANENVGIGGEYVVSDGESPFGDMARFYIRYTFGDTD